VSLGKSLILNNNWLTKYDSVRLARDANPRLARFAVSSVMRGDVSGEQLASQDLASLIAERFPRTGSGTSQGWSG